MIEDDIGGTLFQRCILVRWLPLVRGCIGNDGTTAAAIAVVIVVVGVDVVVV